MRGGEIGIGLGLASDADVTLRIAGAIDRSRFARDAAVYWARTESDAVEGLARAPRGTRPRYAFFPIHVGGCHWVMYVCRPGGRVQFFDSMRGAPDPAVLAALRAWLGEPGPVEVLDVPPQAGSTECGWRCAEFARFLLDVAPGAPADPSSPSIAML